MLRCCVSCSRKGECSCPDGCRERVQAQGASHEQRWRRGWTGTLQQGWVSFLRQISHSIQTFSPTGTFTWLSLWSASSSSASSPSSFAPVAELPPKNTTEEWLHPQLLHVCLKGSFSFQTRVPFQTSMRRCLSGSSSFMILSFSALFFSSRRVWAASWRWACVCFRKFSSTRARFLSAFCLPWRQGGDSKPAAAPSSYGCNNRKRGWVPLTSLLRRSFLTLSML